MAILNDKASLFIGRGQLFIKRADATGLAGSSFDFAEQVTKVDYQANETKLEERDATSADNAILASITIERKPTITCTFKSHLARHLAFALMGDLNTATQAATPVTAEQHLNVKKGGLVKLNKLGPVTALTVQPAGGGTPFVLDTDYSIESAALDEYVWIKILTAGAIADGDGIELGYTPPAMTAIEQVRGGVESEIEVALAFVGKPAYGPRYNFQVWRADVQTDAVVGFVKQETAFGEFDITFTLLGDAANHPNEPFILLERMDTAT